MVKKRLKNKKEMLDLLISEIYRPAREIHGIIEDAGYEVTERTICNWKNKIMEETKGLLNRDYAKELAEKKMKAVNNELNTLQQLFDITSGLREEFDSIKDKIKEDGRDAEDYSKKLFAYMALADRLTKIIDLAMKRLGEYKININSLQETKHIVDISEELKNFVTDLVKRKGELKMEGEEEVIILRDQYELVEILKEDKKKKKKIEVKT